MRVLLQRVISARVTIEDGTSKTFSKSDAFHGEPPRSIGRGLVLFVGIGKNDSPEVVQKMWEKIAKMRIFPDENGKSNYSLRDINGDALIISQFTLYANCKRGNRPNFMDAGAPAMAKDLYIAFTENACANPEISHVAAGEFGADMRVDVVNDGPFSIWLDSESL